MKSSKASDLPGELPRGATGVARAGYLSLWQLRRATADPIAFLLGQARRGDAMEFALRRQRVFLLSHPSLIEQVLITQGDKFSKAPALQRASRLLGRGLLTAEPPLHGDRRRLMQPAFHRQRLDRYAELMAAHAGRAGDRWAAGETVDVVREMTTLALSVVGDSLFGADLGPYEERLGRVLAGALASLDPLVALVAPRARLRPARDRLLALVSEIIDRRRASGAAGDDLLGMLLEASEGDGDDPQVRDDVLTMLLAGHDTVANALTWTWTCLAEHPDADSRLAREIATVLDGRLPTVHDLPRLTYTRAVFAEALRLRPPAWLLARRALDDVRVGDTAIPSGAIVLVSPYVVHRDARFFDDPLVYRPERWLVSDARQRLRLSYFPFGAGRRSCIGEPFAWMEGTVVLATLAGRWRLELVSGAGDVDFRITVRPRGEVRMRPCPRSASGPAVAASPAAIGDGVRDAIRRRQSLDAHAELGDELPLGAEGLGLDSVAIVELLLECEGAFDVKLPPDLMGQEALTIGGLVRAVQGCQLAASRAVS
jgi:cytochrome P450/acyl carrier protein